MIKCEVHQHVDHSTATAMSALNAAWNDDDSAVPYAELCSVDRKLRDLAAAELAADQLGAIYTVALGDRDELDDLLSWIDDPDIWAPVSEP